MTTDVTRNAAAPIRAAFVGGGFMASVHSRAARSARGELSVLASSSAESAARTAASLGFASASDPAGAIAAEVDVVHVLTPNATHLDYALAAIDAGHHVICEKPLATSGADAQRLADAVAAAGLVGAVPFVYRYHPMVREARARVGRGDLGRLLSIQASYLQDWLLSETDDNWRVDDGLGGPSRAFADIGSHLCDLVEFVTGDRIQRIAATKRTFFTDRAEHRGVRTEDAVALVVETAGGAIGTVLVSQAAPGRKNRLAIEVAGSAESIGFDQEQPETLWLGRRVGSQLLQRETELLSPDAARLSIVPGGHPLGYQDAFNAFVADAYAAIRGERPEGLPTFEDGVRAAVLTDAVLASAADGAWVDVPAGVREVAA
ncbi:MAG TPA: Gfo/Idh/MocA family oxidoreductase [Rhodoglobus sp.]|nr:Gfo/Idh/MocA family oxidoreductase [Rhodoglobus sp.]